MKLLHDTVIGIVLWGAVLAGAQGSSIEDVVSRSDHDYANRFRASYHLGSQFNQDGINTMIGFLRRAPSDDVVSADELASLKNNVADVLIEQTGLAPRLLNEFLSMYADPVQGVTWRNYVVQKIPGICVQLEKPEAVARALDFLWSVAHDVKAGYICEAFLGLDRVCSTRPDQVSSAKLRDETIACLLAEQTPPEVKAIVLQILAKHDRVAARQYALSYLAAESIIMLKASSLAVLGKTGHYDDIAMVEPYTLSPDVRLGEAARAALKRLKKEGTPASAR